MLREFKTVAAALAMTLTLSGSVLAQDAAATWPEDNSDVVGTWYGVSTTINLYQFRADGTFFAVPSTYAGVFSRPDNDPTFVGLIGPYLGDWERQEDGTVRVVFMHFEANAAIEGGEPAVEGQLKSYVKGVIIFDPVARTAFQCIAAVRIPDGVYDPATMDPNSQPAIEVCPNPEATPPPTPRMMYRLEG